MKGLSTEQNVHKSINIVNDLAMLPCNLVSPPDTKFSAALSKNLVSGDIAQGHIRRVRRARAKCSMSGWGSYLV